MSQVSFKIYLPGGNRTALVSQKTPQKYYAAVAKKIMKADPTIEQVGFIRNRKGGLRLEMMGGEFCANAARCVAYASMHQSKPFTVSGFNGPVIGTGKKSSASIQLSGELLEAIVPHAYGTIVHLQGISFLVIAHPVSEPFNKKEFLRKLAHGRKAAGIVLVTKSKFRIFVKPLIYVPATNTVTEETACGTGSIAAVLASFPAGRNVKIQVTQPSGQNVTVNLEFERKNLKTIQFAGPVRLEGGGVVEHSLY